MRKGRSLLAEGRAECLLEPRGENGLEGYVRTRTYKFQKMEDAKGIYYRMFPDPESDYYETCPASKFKWFFREIPPAFLKEATIG